MLWKGIYTTGVDEVDWQNFNLLDYVEVMMNTEDNGARLMQLEIFEELVKNFFECEQRLHDECRYFAADRHRYVHENFIEMLGRIKRDYVKTGITLENENLFRKHVVAFFKNHIVCDDRLFAFFYNNNVLRENFVEHENTYVESAV